MKMKNRLMKAGAIMAFIFAFLITTQDTWAITAAASGPWSSTATWTGGVVPTSADDVTIGAFTVTLDQDAEIKSLTLSTATSVLTVGAGDTVNITVNGNISLTDAAARIKGVANTTGRINLVIGAASVITNSVDAVFNGVGMQVHNFTVNNSSVSYAGDFSIMVTGDMSLTGTSSFTPALNTAGTVTFQGGYETIQNITVSSNSYCEFVNFTTAAAANVKTTSDITIREIFTIAAATTFEATAGTTTFDANGAALVTPVATGTTKFFDVLFNCATNGVAPATSFLVGGDFTKIGTQNFAPTAGVITFENADALGKNIQLLGGTNNFYQLAIGSAPNYKFTKVKTTSNFEVTGTAVNAIEVVESSSLIAEAGTITMNGAAGIIVNSATGTLKFNNLTFPAAATAATTASSFTINGDLSLAAASVFSATAGTITFENSLQRTISNAGTEVSLIFWNLAVAANSDITCANNFTVLTNLDLASNSELTVTGGAGVETHFDGAGAQVITVASDANLELSDVIIGATADPTVTTASSFKVNGTAFTLTDANDFFSATAGTVTFTAACVLTNPTALANLIFYNLLADGAAVTDAAGDFVTIKGDLTLNNAGASYTSGAASTVSFTGTTNSIIGGTTTANPVATFDVLVINKSNATGEVQLIDNVNIANTATSTITLTNGILNLGSQILIVGANVIPTTAGGAINGSTGTYVISTGHNATGLVDALFTINGVPTLYNLDVLVAHTMGAGALTINGDLEFTGAVALTIPASQTLSLYGNMIHTAAGTIVGAAAATSVLKLKGTGTCDALLDANFGTMPSITFERGETLTGNLTMIAANVFTMNSSINQLDLGAYTLTFNATTVLSLVSGSIKADLGSVVFSTHASQTTIPANLFTNNTINNMTISTANVTLGSDLIINGTLTNATPSSIITNNNTLTFGPSSVGIATFTAAKPIIGNLARTVTSSATTYPLGTTVGAAAYRPVILQFATLGSSQVVKVSSSIASPTVGRAGDPTKSVNLTWDMVPQGVAPNDSLKLTFGWPAGLETEVSANYNECFYAKWNSLEWNDYRLVTAGAVAAPRVLVPTSYPVLASNLAGTWAVFVATANTDAAKDLAIINSSYKLAFTNITPNPVRSGFPFSATVQLQDRYGNPVSVPTADGAYTANITTSVGSALSGTPVPVVIPAGQNMATVSGLSITAANGEAGTQLKAALQTPTTLAGGVLAGISSNISILADQPTGQVSAIVLTSGQATSTTLTYTLAAPAIVIAKAGSAITDADFPVDGTTYYASTNFGQGSAIGDAVVVYKAATAPGTPVTINGLAPNTTYYFRAFAYSGTSNGAEKYLTFSSAGNPKTVTTTGSTDDDAVYGNNNTRSLSRPIGTNSVIQGRISSASDEDWFSFAVTSISPNIRVRLYDLPGNYSVELYDMTGRRIRRSTLNSMSNEAFIANELPVGTYTVRILSADGTYYTTTGDEYYLKVSTSGAEIFSVTP